jgi:hypothetical protein
MDPFVIARRSFSFPVLFSSTNLSKFLMIGVPTSIALSNPAISPEEKVFHPKPNTANMIATNKMK